MRICQARADCEEGAGLRCRASGRTKEFGNTGRNTASCFPGLIFSVAGGSWLILDESRS